MPLFIEPHFHQPTSTATFLIWDTATLEAAVIDPVLDYEARSSRLSTEAADEVLRSVEDHGLTLRYVLETHAHADHLSAAGWLRDTLGGRIGVGRNIVKVQETFRALFHLGDALRADGGQFDHLFDDGEAFAIGTLEARVIAMPGHTPACVAYQVGDAVFVGDTLFMPDVGTARCDFPGGSAEQLYRSIRQLLARDPATRLFMCHDYPPDGRAPRWETTVGEQRASNIHVHDGIAEAGFVAMRTARDSTLDMPTLLLPSIQVNIRAGRLPEPEANGVSYLKIPLNAV